MTKYRMHELLAPFFGQAALSDGQLSLVSSYLDLLVKWNSKLNLTAVRDPEQIVQRHFGESFFAAGQLFPDPTASRGLIADLGSGAGFPGLPIKLWAQQLELKLIESQQKKATFLREVVRTLNLESVEVVQDRAENLRFQADVVSLRAVESFEKAVPTAASLVKPGGNLALLIGNSQVETAKALLPNFAWNLPIPVPLSESRVLLSGQLAI